MFKDKKLQILAPFTDHPSDISYIDATDNGTLLVPLWKSLTNAAATVEMQPTSPMSSSAEFYIVQKIEA